MPQFLSLLLLCEFSEESWSSEEKELQTGASERRTEEQKKNCKQSRWLAHR